MHEAHTTRSLVTHGSSAPASDCPDRPHEISECGSAPYPLEVAGQFGEVQVMHGSDCVGLVMESSDGSRAAMVMTPTQARILARMLQRQADAASEA